MSYSYSNESERVWNQLDKDLQLIFSVVLNGMDHKLLVGHRNKEDQQEAYESGNSQVQWPNSYHNSYPSMAVDATPYPVPEKWGEHSRDEYEKFRYFAFYVLGVADVLYKIGAIEHQLEWGGDWDNDMDVTDNNFNDLLHFQLRRQ